VILRYCADRPENYLSKSSSEQLTLPLVLSEETVDNPRSRGGRRWLR
jgi:hypothetical protein